MNVCGQYLMWINSLENNFDLAFTPWLSLEPIIAPSSLKLTQFLHKKNHLLEAAQSHTFIQEFQSDLWDSIKCHLKLKFTNHFPDDPYPIQIIHDAAKYVLYETLLIPVQRHNTTMSQATVPTPVSKTEDITIILGKFS